MKQPPRPFSTRAPRRRRPSGIGPVLVAVMPLDALDVNDARVMGEAGVLVGCEVGGGHVFMTVGIGNDEAATLTLTEEQCAELLSALGRALADAGAKH